MTTNDHGWIRSTVPYKPNPNALQTVDIWVPPTANLNGKWVIYIHGGAWRDPLVLSDSFSATVSHIVADQDVSTISGIASIDYSLSPHPHHPTHPSPPKDPSQPIDPSRNARHPDHILDVLTALRYLQDKYHFGSQYVLLGHSCGATLALQVAMDHTKWGQEAAALKVSKPNVIIGLNGLYDMPSLIHEPGGKHKELVPVYTAFTKLAFGDDEKQWQRISPVSVDDWATEWSPGKEVILAQSLEDSLVPYSQTEEMLSNFNASKSGSLKVREVPFTGDHNFLWEDGRRLAEIVADAVKGL
jgi:acetyl esterase/lipase